MDELTSKRLGRPRKVLGILDVAKESEVTTPTPDGDGQAGPAGTGAPAESVRQSQRRVLGNMARMIAGESFIIRKH